MTCATRQPRTPGGTPVHRSGRGDPWRRGLGCRFAQGFLLARPTEAENCAPFLSNTPLRLHDVGNDVLATIAVGSN